MLRRMHQGCLDQPGPLHENNLFSSNTRSASSMETAEEGRIKFTKAHVEKTHPKKQITGLPETWADCLKQLKH